MKIYTKSGDQGETSLFGGGRVPKRHLRVEAYGTIDEVNSVLGLARAAGASAQANQWLEEAQNQLFRLGSDLAAPPGVNANWLKRVSAEDVAWLEKSIDRMTSELPPLKNFILPGGTLAAAQIHVARAVCRRAERLIAALNECEDIGGQALPYVNRLSDWLFTLARYENLRAGKSETLWNAR